MHRHPGVVEGTIRDIWLWDNLYICFSNHRTKWTFSSPGPPPGTLHMTIARAFICFQVADYPLWRPPDVALPSLFYVPWTSVWPSVGAGWRWVCAGAAAPRWCLSCRRRSYRPRWTSASATWWHGGLRKRSIKIKYNPACRALKNETQTLHRFQPRIIFIMKL